MMKTLHILVVDGQNDFMDQEENLSDNTKPSSLSVPGASADMRRLAAFIAENSSVIGSLILTLDSHPAYSIERTTFWKDVSPFTLIKLEDFNQGKYELADPSKASYVAQYLADLKASGQQLCVWPVHCIDGEWGANLQKDLMRAVNDWEISQRKFALKIHKGQNGLTEQYSAVKANVPLLTDPRTTANMPLVEEASQNDGYLVITGEALSHCVASTVRDILALSSDKELAKRCILVTDGCSSVPGFENWGQAFIEELRSQGGQVMSFAELATFVAQ